MFATRVARYVPSAIRANATKFMRTKMSTDVAGLEIHPDPLPELESLYTKTLGVLKALPSSSVFRQSSEAVTEQRLSVVREAMTENSRRNAYASEAAIDNVVKQLDSGLIEEILDQAHDEHHLVTKMIEWKPYESLQVPAPPGQWKGFSMKEAAGEGH
ncbi:hypothetical protein MNAN1_002135 [Malassezia nana]|uniref:NADH dehydrogenase [ubiquinone] 1 alpha subcomplex subunit 5 n=1 Tax=Malassezia nana TaxID=180528 RepID=A0AAF0EJZ8_9BASI|nr:hypothetical protein MNAN1_002135 [Malassezia nana]